MKNEPLMTVVRHSKWKLAEAKLAEIGKEISGLRSREGELAEIIASGPRGPSATIEAMQLLDGVVDMPHADKLQSVVDARAELNDIRGRVSVLEQARTMLTTRMHNGDGDHRSLASLLSLECCQAAASEFLARTREIQTAAENLRDKLLAAEHIANILEEGGGTIHDPIRRIYGPFGGISFPDNNPMTLWLTELTRYLTEMERASASAA